MRKFVFGLLVLVINFNLNAKNIDTSYYPKYNNDISKSEYNRGLEILKNSYRQIIEDNNREPYYADYWNVATAYAIMFVEKENVWKYLKKAKSLNNENFCIIVNSSVESKEGIENTTFYKFLGDEFVSFISDCKGIINSPESIEKKLKRKHALDLSKLNEVLIDQLIILSEKDQRYRYQKSVYDKNWKAQTDLDNEVQTEMILILDEYGYPGKDLVGETFMNRSCMLIEHFLSLEHQEKYLPMVVKAYHDGQLNKNYLTMLIDRIHSKKTGKQIFGSHVDVPFESVKELKRIKSKYGLE